MADRELGEGDMSGERDCGADEVVAAIEAEFARFPGSGGVAARQLDTGEEIRVNADETTATASTIKVPILIELFRQIEAGALDLETRLPASAAARTVGSGILRELSEGVELSIRDHATLMIVISDNTSTNVLIDLLGIDRINQTMAELGFTRTQLRERLDFPKIGPDARNLAMTTPSELAAIMEALATGAILNDESRAAIFDIMGRQHGLNLIPRYLPYYPHPGELGHPDNGLRIANKTGGWTGMRADMALVEWPGVRYVAAIVIEGDPDRRFWAENAGDQVIGRVSRLIFDHFGGAVLDDVDATPAAAPAEAPAQAEAPASAH
ncbi:MAG TPA: serine hydrolase [Thermomicrobiales bacterium]|nr:serine hydrolase [Thermomicrobiales bacterium]